MTTAEALDKIRKLLRMKRGGTQAEIETALALAAELARKHGIDIAGDARNSIRTADLVVIYMAAKFELQRPPARISMMNMLRSRLKKLTGLNYPKFPGEPD